MEEDKYKYEDYWQATINRTRNGFSVAFKGGDCAVHKIQEKVYQDSDDDNEALSEIKSFVEMVQELRDFFAVHNDKHQGVYLNIEVENENE